MNSKLTPRCSVYYRTTYFLLQHSVRSYDQIGNKFCTSFGQLLTRCYGTIFLSKARLQSKFVENEPLTPDGETSVTDSDVKTCLHSLLRRAGPLPLSRINSYLDDRSMEFISTYVGGLVRFCSQYPRLFHLVALPNRIHVLINVEDYIFVPPRDRKICIYVSAALVTALYMPKAIDLPVTPTTDQMFRFIRDNVEELILDKRVQLSALDLRTKLRRYSIIFTFHGDRFCLTRHRFLFVDNTTENVAQSLGFAKACRPFSTSHFSSDTSNSDSTSLSVSSEFMLKAAQTIAFVTRHVPVTFFVPLSYLMQCQGTNRLFGSDDTFTTVHSTIKNAALKNFLLTHVLSPTLEGTYMRRIKPAASHCSNSGEVFVSSRDNVQGNIASTEAVLLDHEGPERAAQAYNIFSFGRKIGREIKIFKDRSELNRIRLVKGVSMKELELEILSKDLVEQIKDFFRAGKLPESDSAFYLLIFDRLRHLYDVDIQQMRVRPWEVLQLDDQPSSLTAATTPLPLVLHNLQLALSQEPLSIMALFKRLSPLCKQHLLSLYHDESWLEASVDKLDKHDTIVHGCSSLQDFVNVHSFYFVERSDGLLCTPAYLAAEASKTVPSRSSNGTVHFEKGKTKRLSEFEMAEMVYNILPRHGVVIWEKFSKTYQVRKSLPFDAYKFHHDFFRRHDSYFSVYESFFSNRLIVARSDATPPPQDILQPRLNNIEAIIKYIALHAVGGTTEVYIMTRMSREGRAFMKSFGTCIALVKQLPEWFEVREDKFYPGNSIITYIGKGNSSPTQEDKYFEEFLPFRKKVNDASLSAISPEGNSPK